MINRLIRAQGFDLRLETNLEEIVDDGSGRAGAVVVGRKPVSASTASSSA